MPPGPDPTPPCACEDCSSLRSAIAAIDLQEAVTHDDGQAVLIEVAGKTITLAEAWLRRIIGGEDDTQGASTSHRADASTLLRALLTESYGVLIEKRLADAQKLITRHLAAIATPTVGAAR